MSAHASVPPAAPAAPDPTASGADGRPRWHVGTLTYTTGGLVVLFCWLLWGDFAWSMKDRAVTPVAQLVLRQYGASDFLVGLLVGSLPSAIGFILGPIISVKSDHHRGNWGRRIPFLLIPTPFITLGMFGLAYSGPLANWAHAVLGDSSPGLGFCRLGVFALSWTLFEIFQTVAQAVFNGLINDVVPQQVIGRFLGLFRAISLLAAIIFNLFLIEHTETHSFELFLGLGLLFGVGFAVMCFKVKEGSYPPPPPAPPVANLSERVVKPIAVYLKECFSKPYYLWVFLAITLGALAGGPVNSFSVFHAKSLGLDLKYYGRLLVVTYCCSFVLSYFVGWMADKFHPLRLGIASLALYAVIMLWGGFTAGTTSGFSIAFVAHGVLMGVFLTGTASLGQRLFPREQFAQFMSAAGIAGAIGYVILPPALGLVLDMTGHNYRIAFFLSGLISLGAVAAFLGVYRRFQVLGGHAGYAPPQ
jgi:maltose/moltooligosaccharide transporter